MAFLQRLSNETAEEFRNDPKKKIRVSTKLARYFLLSYPTLTIGMMQDDYETATKSIGAGVHELYLKKKEG